MDSAGDLPEGGVSPFGHPRINGRSHLPAAYRSVPRPSSPPSAKASTGRPFHRPGPTHAAVVPRIGRANAHQRHAYIGLQTHAHNTRAKASAHAPDPLHPANEQFVAAYSVSRLQTENSSARRGL